MGLDATDRHWVSDSDNFQQAKSAVEFENSDFSGITLAYEECTKRALIVNPGKTEPNTYSHEYDWRNNAIGFLRLVLAASVIIGHGPMLGGYPNLGLTITGPWFGWGEVAVMGFFTLSGILITKSWESSKGAKDFFTKRFLRIMPGYIFALIMCAFVFGPIGWMLQNQTSSYPWSGPNSAITYVTNNFTTKMNQDFIEGAWVMHGKQQGVNFPLWTIISELTCYVITGFLGIVGIGKRHRVWFVAFTALLLGFLAYQAAKVGFVHDGAPSRLTHLFSYMLGVCIYYYHEHIPLRPWAGWLCAVIAWGCSWYAPAMLVFPIFFAYAVVVAGFLGKPKQIEKRGDISYGVYLYGWPVQLIVSLLIGKSVGVWGYILISAIVVIPFGILSWLLVEKPSIGLVKRFGKPKPVAPSES